MSFKTSLLPRAAALALGTAGSLIQSAYRNYSVRVPPLSTRPDMAMSKRPAPSTMRSTRYRKRARYNRKGMRPTLKRLVRSSNIGTWSISIGQANNASASDIKLSDVQLTDLTGLYRQYRIVKAVLHVSPRVDPANSGVSNNWQAVIAAACDPDGATAPSNLKALTAYGNSYQKWVNSGEDFTYTFYPKVINTVDVTGVATAAGGYARNPWLSMTTGTGVPHKQLLTLLQTGTATTVALSFDFYWDIHFDVKTD